MIDSGPRGRGAAVTSVLGQECSLALRRLATLCPSQGTEDQIWDVGMAQRLVARLAEAGSPPEAHFFEGEGHVFRAEARNREWVLLVDFFARHLTGAVSNHEGLLRVGSRSTSAIAGQSGGQTWIVLTYAMVDRQWFELRRQSDNLIYTFRRCSGPDGQAAYQRQDGDYWITVRPGLGWVAWDETTQSCMGRPWDVPPAAQDNFPLEGVWASRKGAKSYVYDLIYIITPRPGGIMLPQG